jgi:hypothetical protein
MKKYKACSYADSEKRTAGRFFRTLPSIIPLIFFLSRCGGEQREDFSSRARSMLLTSDHTEIVLFSAKVPGYWAKQLSEEQEFFLSTQVHSYKKGDQVKVEGPFGNAFASVYRDETGVYLSAYRQGIPTAIIVVWKMAEYKVQKDAQPTSKKDNR